MKDRKLFWFCVISIIYIITYWCFIKNYNE
uniref:ABC transporter ATP-binding protein n=1 Tax=virus sp. ctML55 TaxID=2827627 RepID=A0A8S5RHW5_9VIRU|nr:MAG TPA: ABC transporter ATP-binding protein [virus sp. ctML55]DAG30444.1 MAG TPA: ABC transporter ATP-binding protein [Bacteriophage sp.]